MSTQALEISHIRDQAKPSAIIVSDASATVAWYGDRSSLWLPATPQQMREIKLLTAQKGQPLTGILLTRKSSQISLYKMIYGRERDWAPLIAGRAIAFAGLRQLQPKSWTLAGENMVASMKDLDFTKLNTAMIAKGFFYLESTGE